MKNKKNEKWRKKRLNRQRPPKADENSDKSEKS
jgi:hypothetical protein